MKTKKPSKNPTKRLTKLAREFSPEERKFGLMLKYLDGTITPEELAKFQKQLRKDPRYLTEFADTLLMDLQLRDIAREERIPRPRPNSPRRAQDKPPRVR